jgi:hypothetical protein
MWERLLHIDRRFIYLLLFAVVLLPLLLNWKLPPGYTNPWTQAMYDYVEKLPAGTPVLVAFDFEPATSPELLPMATALTRHVMRRHLRLIAMTFAPGGVLLAQGVLDQVAKEEGRTYGEDYVNLGYNPNAQAVWLGMGESIKQVFITDTKKNPTATLPVMRGVHDYKQLGLIIDITGTGLTGGWIAFAHQRFHAPVAAGVTSVVAMDLYPYLRTGQLVGLLNGIAGAAEYEKLLNAPDQGMLAMPAVTAVHVLMVLLVLLGNLAYFASRRRAAVPQPEPPQPPTGEEV